MTLALVAMLALFAAPAAAAGQQPCAASHRESQLAACWQRQREIEEARVDKALRQLIDRNLDDEPGLAEALRASQAAWTAWRDIQCRADTWDSRRGTAAGVYLDQCLAGYSGSRAAALAAMVASP